MIVIVSLSRQSLVWVQRVVGPHPGRLILSPAAQESQEPSAQRGPESRVPELPIEHILSKSQAFASAITRGFGSVRLLNMAEHLGKDDAHDAQLLTEFVVGVLQRLQRQSLPAKVPGPLAHAMRRVEDFSKAVLCIIFPVPQCFDSSIMHVKKILNYVGSEFMESELRQMLRGDEWWKAQVQAAEAKASVEHEVGPLLQEVGKALAQATSAVDGYMAMKKAYESLLKYGEQLRPGGTMHLEGTMFDSIVPLVDNIMALQLQELHDANINVDIVTQVLNHAIKLEGQEKDGQKFSDALRRLTTWVQQNQEIMRQLALQEFHMKVMADHAVFDLRAFQKLVQVVSLKDAASDVTKQCAMEPVAVMLLYFHKKAAVVPASGFFMTLVIPLVTCVFQSWA